MKTPSKKAKLIYAKDLKCCQCGQPAVCFWPIIDPDIQEHPYCRKCKDEAVMRVLIGMHEADQQLKIKKHV